MKKLLVSVVAIIATVGTTMAAETCNGGCKSKKIRVIHITAGDPHTMYDDTQYTTTVLDSDGTVVEYPEYAEPATLSVASARGSDYEGNWYVGGRVGLHLVSWKNKYKGAPSNYAFDNSENHDDYTFEPVFGGNIFAGYRFTPNWRGDVEFGYMTQFSDSDNGFTFKLQTPYITANAYYDFESGVYLGAGVGVAFPRATMDWEYFEKDSASETKLSFTGALMAGYSYNLSKSVALDFRYRLSGFIGPKWTRNLVSDPKVQDVNGVVLESLETKVGFVIDNSLSLGLRYEF